MQSWGVPEGNAASAEGFGGEPMAGPTTSAIVSEIIAEANLRSLFTRETESFPYFHVVGSH